MLWNYLLTLWRTVSRQPLYTFLNLASMSAGIATVLFIVLYIHFEYTFDSQHEKADQIYRVETRQIYTHDRVMDVTWRSVPGNLATYLKQDYPEVKSVFRHYTFNVPQITFEFGDKKITEEAIYFVDTSVFEILDISFQHGQSGGALGGPNKIVLSAQLAQSLFGQENPVGKLITTHSTSTEKNQSLSLLVTGVYKDFPQNSHWIPNAMVSVETDPNHGEHYFNSFNFPTYVLLREGVDKEKFSSKLSDIYEKYLDPSREPVMKKAEHLLIPLNSIHFEETEGRSYIYIFGATGLLLLLLATISYVNLAIAQTSKRALEVGLRKVMGSDRRQIILQFLAESFLFTFLAFGLGLFTVSLIIGPVNEWLSLELASEQLARPEIIIALISIAIGLGVLGGSYPAFFLSSFQPIEVLKGRISTGGKRHPIRKILVGAQFVVVIFVLVSTAMVHEQLQFIRSKNLGFDKTQMLSLAFPTQQNPQHIELFKQSLEQSPHIHAMSQATFLPGTGNMTRAPLSVETPQGPQQDFTYRGRIDIDFFSTMNIPIVQGRAFSPDFSTDSTQGAIINETFAQKFSLEEPLGTKIRIGGQANPNFIQVVGVVKDFHESSLHVPIQAQLFRLGRAGESMPNLILKIEDDLRQGIADVQKSWEAVFPEVPFAYHFLDEVLQTEYEADRLRGKIFLAISLITLLISFLGLFGLASFLTEQRVREIGIRKVLGARLSQILVLLTRPFIYLLALSAIPAFVFSYIFINNWLENFAFHASMNYLYYALVLAFALTLTLTATGIHALKAAKMDPARTLRDE